MPGAKPLRPGATAHAGIFVRQFCRTLLGLLLGRGRAVRSLQSVINFAGQMVNWVICQLMEPSELVEHAANDKAAATDKIILFIMHLLS